MISNVVKYVISVFGIIIFVLFIFFNFVKIIDVIKKFRFKVRVKKLAYSKKQDKSIENSKTKSSQITLLYIIKFFKNSSWKMINKYMINIFCICFTVLVLVDRDIFNKLSSFISLFCILPIIYVVFILPFSMLNIYIANSHYKIDKMYNTILIIVTLFTYAIAFAGTTLQFTIIKNRGDSSLFQTIIFILIFIFSISIYSIINILRSSKPNTFKLIFGVGVLCTLVVYQYFLFGIYNMTTENWNSIIDTNNLKLFIRIMNYGTIHLSEIPTPTGAGSLIPFIQYLIAKFVDVFVIGFMVAYFYDYIKNQNNK